MKILVLNGPNLNFLGIREPEIYGSESYGTLCKRVAAHCAQRGIEAEFFQSNHEGDLIDRIQDAYGNAAGIVFNPGAYAHTSIALLDAVKAVGIPTVEVHITDLSKRESFRRVSFVGAACVKTISGHGLEGYIEAVDFLAEYCCSESREN